jgi:predicted dehydrogenase
MEPISLGIVGTGWTRISHAPVLRRMPSRFRVRAIYSRTREHAERMAAEFEQPVSVHTDLDGLLASGVEAVDVALPIHLTAEGVERALLAGKHVLSEKPVAADSASAARLIALAAERPAQRWMVAEQQRLYRAPIEAHRLVAEGAIGTPLLCCWQAFVPVKATPFLTDWRTEPRFAGGFVVDGLVHDVAALRNLLGEVRTVQAHTATTDPALPPPDTLAATLAFESGVLATLSASYALEAPPLSRANVARALLTGRISAVKACFFPAQRLVGARGTIFIQGDRVDVVSGWSKRTLRAKGDTTTRLFEDFHGAIRDGEPNRNSPQEALRDLAVVEAMLESARTGATALVRDPDRVPAPPQRRGDGERRDAIATHHAHAHAPRVAATRTDA